MPVGVFGKEQGREHGSDVDTAGSDAEEMEPQHEGGVWPDEEPSLAGAPPLRCASTG